jgi:hypothetical protein
VQGNEMMLFGRDQMAYPNVRCKVVYDCGACGAVSWAWATPEDPIVLMPDDLRELRERANANR